MAEKIKLVQGDTRPALVVTVTDQTTGDPIGLTGATVRLKFREAGSETVKATLTGTLLPGILVNGSISVASPYDTPGAGGRVSFAWTAAALDTSGEFEGEIEVTFSDTSIQTVYDKLKFKVREQF